MRPRANLRGTIRVCHGQSLVLHSLCQDATLTVMPPDNQPPTPFAGIEEELGALLARISAGDEQAAQDFIGAYGEHVLRVVRRQLSQPLRRWFDSTDFTQAVWHAVLADPAVLCQCRTPGDLIRFLTAVASNQVAEEHRKYFRAAKRDIRREQSLDAPAATASDPASSEPPPEQCLIAQETHHKAVDIRFPQEYAPQLCCLSPCGSADSCVCRNRRPGLVHWNAHDGIYVPILG